MRYLRAIEPEDLDLMYIVENDLAVCRYSSTNVPLSRYALRRYIEESRGDLFADSQVRMAIMDADKGEACGFLDITDLDARHRRAQVGIVLLPEAQGRGIAAGALDEAAMYARQQGLHQLYAIVASDNQRARNLFLRSSYTETALLPQWLCIDGIYADAVLFQLMLDNNK
ncbi:MAG: GNAT family N-acetyltransferase [Bacteroidaceae bacterium]|nr:GNAT family N-acetyltransferase [Bacteroidaceae bacterium]